MHTSLKLLTNGPAFNKEWLKWSIDDPDYVRVNKKTIMDYFWSV